MVADWSKTTVFTNSSSEELEPGASPTQDYDIDRSESEMIKTQSKSI